MRVLDPVEGPFEVSNLAPGAQCSIHPELVFHTSPVLDFPIGQVGGRETVALDPHEGLDLSPILACAFGTTGAGVTYHDHIEVLPLPFDGKGIRPCECGLTKPRASL